MCHTEITRLSVGLSEYIIQKGSCIVIAVLILFSFFTFAVGVPPDTTLVIAIYFTFTFRSASVSHFLPDTVQLFTWGVPLLIDIS